MDDKTPEGIAALLKECGSVNEYTGAVVFQSHESLQAFIAALTAQPVRPADAEAVMKWLDANCRRVSWNIDGASFEITDDQAFALVNFFTAVQPAKSVLKSLLNKLDSRIGAHPLSVNGVPRTERQNGWNDCSTQVSAICDEVNETIAQQVQPAQPTPEQIYCAWDEAGRPCGLNLFTSIVISARKEFAQPVQTATAAVSRADFDRVAQDLERGKQLVRDVATLLESGLEHSLILLAIGERTGRFMTVFPPAIAQPVQPAKQQSQDALDAARPVTDAMVEAYLVKQREVVEEADKFGRPNAGGLHSNTVKEACRAGITAAIAARGAKS